MTTTPAKPTTPPPAPTTASALAPAPEGFINVFVDGQLLFVKKGSTVMAACKQAEKEIPHFCYHERLSIAGNCRMCLVEIEGMPKPVASCHWPAAEGMKIRTESKITQDARKGTMELLLANHPLDCPICDQGGECQLQDQAVAFGSDRSHYHEEKRAVEDLDIGAKIKTVFTRCIHCTRCVRFATEIAGVEEFGATGRGENMHIGTYVEQALQSELAGNMIDLCPVGALTSKPYAFTARPWELVRTHSIDILDAVGTPITVDNRHGQVMRVLPKECNEINEEWLTDVARFSTDSLFTNRLTTPIVHGHAATWPQAFAAITSALEGATPKNTAGIMGSMASAEDATAFKLFMQHVLGTTNYSCLPAGRDAAHPSTFQTPLAEIENADAVLLIGCNPRLEAPLLNLRLRRMALKKKIPIAAAMAPAELTFKVENLGSTASVLQDVAAAKQGFGITLKSAKNPCIIIGAKVLERPDAATILAIAEKLGKINILEATCGRITAHHMGAQAVDTKHILDRGHDGKLQALFLHGEDTIQANDLKGKTAATIIYLGTHLTPLAAKADILLPTAAWTEKPSLFSNLEGRVQRADQAVQPPLQAKEDWKIYRALSEELGKTLPFNTLSQLRDLIAQTHPAYQTANIGRILPQTPTKAAKPAETKLKSEPFTPTISNYYQHLEYLRQSPTMQACAAEQGQAKIKKVA